MRIISILATLCLIGCRVPLGDGGWIPSEEKSARMRVGEGPWENVRLSSGYAYFEINAASVRGAIGVYRASKQQLLLSLGLYQKSGSTLSLALRSVRMTPVQDSTQKTDALKWVSPKTIHNGLTWGSEGDVITDVEVALDGPKSFTLDLDVAAAPCFILEWHLLDGSEDITCEMTVCITGETWGQ